MLDQLRAWLNGNREYFSGVVLYSKLVGDDALFRLLKKGSTDFTCRRLEEELLAICNELKQKQNGSFCPTSTTFPGRSVIPSTSSGTSINQDKQVSTSITAEASDRNRQTPSKEENTTAEASEPVNPELYAACKLKADKLYKEVMNNRAVLFALAKSGEYEDPNTPDQVAARSKLAIAVVVGFQQVSQLYDEAKYVKLHGRLPYQVQEEENEYDALPDHLVKQTLDNIRKNVNKMKKREQTPERVALIQKHQENIQKLEARWRLLKPVN